MADAPGMHNPNVLPPDIPAPIDDGAARHQGRWVALISLDLRSLALFRVCLGLILLADLGIRAGDLHPHYTDAGVLRADEIALLVGFYTRAATFLSFVLLLSLHNRNPLVLHGGDSLLRLLLFWSLLLPLGACWSLDRRLGLEPPPPGDAAASAATAGFAL